jgi:hypothetical protein
MTIKKNDLIKVINGTLDREYSTAKNITAATKAALCQITAVSHGYATGNNVFIQDVVGMIELNNKYYVVTYVSVDTFTIGVNSSAYTAYTSGGTVIRDDLDAEIISTLKDISQLGNFLQDEYTVPTIIDRDYYSLPEDMKDLLFIGMKSSDDLTIYKPLEYERFEMYKRNIYYDDTSGTPERYTWESGYMYLRPIPDAIYNLYLWYSYYHPETVTVDSVSYKACDYILFKDIYREAIELGLLYKVALHYGLDQDVQKFKTLYLGEIGIRKRNLKEHVRIAVYRDGF